MTSKTAASHDRSSSHTNGDTEFPKSTHVDKDKIKPVPESPGEHDLDSTLLNVGLIPVLKGNACN